MRVAGPFTVESLSPHRVLGVDENDELIKDPSGEYGEKQSFPQMILENLKTAGVQQAHKQDKITFTALTPWPGDLVCAEGRFEASGQWLVASGQKEQSQGTRHKPLATELRAAIFIGPEFAAIQELKPSDFPLSLTTNHKAQVTVHGASGFNSYEEEATRLREKYGGPIVKKPGRKNAVPKDKPAASIAPRKKNGDDHPQLFGNGEVVGTFASRSKAGQEYVVKRATDGTLCCNCKGWIFNKTCRHLKEAGAWAQSSAV